MRSALRTEIRRARRDGNTQLANSLGAQLASENLRRAANGDSNIGSADSDIREQRAYDSLKRQQLGQQARLASAAAMPPPRRETGGIQEYTGDVGLNTGGGAPSPAGGTPSQPAGSTTAPSTDVPPTATPPAGGDTGAGSQPPATPPAAPAPAGDTLARTGGGRINGLPAEAAISQAEFKLARERALNSAPDGEAFGFENTQIYKDQVEYIRQQQGKEAADEFDLEQRKQFFRDYGEKHGFDAQLKLHQLRSEQRKKNEIERFGTPEERQARIEAFQTQQAFKANTLEARRQTKPTAPAGQETLARSVAREAVRPTARPAATYPTSTYDPVAELTDADLAPVEIKERPQPSRLSVRFEGNEPRGPQKSYLERTREANDRLRRRREAAGDTGFTDEYPTWRGTLFGDAMNWLNKPAI